MKNRIKATREAKGWSLEVLASKTGTTNQQISLLESGKRRLTVDWLARLAEALQCHPWDLVSASVQQPGSPDEIRLIDLFRCLTSRQQEAVLTLVGTMSVRPSRAKDRKAA